MANEVLIEVSARHIHLSCDVLQKLFGEGYELEKLKDLSQPGQFAAKEIVKIEVKDDKGMLKSFDSIRVTGPCREYAQVEISRTDAFFLGLGYDVPLRLSGNIEGSPGFRVIGPAGEAVLNEGLIVAKRHLHTSPKDAEILGIDSGDKISVEIGGERGLVFNNIEVRVNEDFKLAVHIDTDEGNAAGIVNEGVGIILEK